MGFFEFMYLTYNVMLFSLLFGAIIGEAEGKRQERKKRERRRRRHAEWQMRRNAEYREMAELLTKLP